MSASLPAAAEAPSLAAILDCSSTGPADGGNPNGAMKVPGSRPRAQAMGFCHIDPGRCIEARVRREIGLGRRRHRRGAQRSGNLNSALRCRDGEIGKGAAHGGRAVGPFAHHRSTAGDQIILGAVTQGDIAKPGYSEVRRMPKDVSGTSKSQAS